MICTVIFTYIVQNSMNIGKSRKEENKKEKRGA